MNEAVGSAPAQKDFPQSSESRIILTFVTEQETKTGTVGFVHPFPVCDS